MTEKNPLPVPDVVEGTLQDTEGKEPDVAPSLRIPQAKIKNNAAFNPIGSYQLSSLFERTFIDLGGLMMEEGFDLVTYTKVQGLLNEDWKFT